MITHETYQFICKACDQGYRGLVKKCPHCGAVLREPIKYEEPKEQKAWKLPEDYYDHNPRPDVRFDALRDKKVWEKDRFTSPYPLPDLIDWLGHGVYEANYDSEGNLTGYSLLPKK